MGIKNLFTKEKKEVDEATKAKRKKIIKIVLISVGVTVAAIGIGGYLHHCNRELPHYCDDTKDLANENNRESLIKKFVELNKPLEGSPNTLKDIDDMELIDLYIDDVDFRKEYGVSDSEYERYKKELG